MSDTQPESSFTNECDCLCHNEGLLVNHMVPCCDAMVSVDLSASHAVANPTFFLPGVHFPGIVVEFFITDGMGNWLLHKRSEKCRDERGTWDFGGGQLEFGEDRYAALVRELREEYGLEEWTYLSQQLPGYSIFRRAGNEGEDVSHWEVIPYIITTEDWRPTIKNPDKMDEARWVGLDDLMHGKLLPMHSAIPYVLKRYYDDFRMERWNSQPEKLDALLSSVEKKHYLDLSALPNRPLDQKRHPYTEGLCHTRDCYNPAAPGRGGECVGCSH